MYMYDKKRFIIIIIVRVQNKRSNMGVGAYPVNPLFVVIITCVRQGISVAKLPGVCCWLNKLN